MTHHCSKCSKDYVTHCFFYITLKKLLKKISNCQLFWQSAHTHHFYSTSSMNTIEVYRSRRRKSYQDQTLHLSLNSRFRLISMLSKCHFSRQRLTIYCCLAVVCHFTKKWMQFLFHSFFKHALCPAGLFSPRTKTTMNLFTSVILTHNFIPCKQ